MDVYDRSVSNRPKEDSVDSVYGRGQAHAEAGSYCDET